MQWSLINLNTYLLKSGVDIPINLFVRKNVQHSARFVQTTRVVCTNFSRSLHKLRLKSPEFSSTIHLCLNISIIFKHLAKKFQLIQFNLIRCIKSL